MDILNEIKTAIITYKPNIAKEACQRAIAAGISPQVILSEGIMAGLNVVGEKFKRNEVFVPEVLIAAKATHAGLDVLKPHLAARSIEPLGTIVIGTVKEDLHDIGKNLVAMMLEGAGFNVINLGVDVKPERFVEAIKEYKPDIVAMSSLITSTLQYLEETIKVFDDAGVRKDVLVMVGGAPVTAEYARSIGADGYGKDAAEAVEVARSLLKVG